MLGYLPVLVMQYTGMIIPVAAIVILLRREQNRMTMHLSMANIGVFIMNYAYLMQLRASSYQEALSMYKIEYIGNVIFYLFFALFIYSFWVKGKKSRFIVIVIAIWLAIEAVSFASVFTDANLINQEVSVNFRQDDGKLFTGGLNRNEHNAGEVSGDAPGNDNNQKDGDKAPINQDNQNNKDDIVSELDKDTVLDSATTGYTYINVTPGVFAYIRYGFLGLMFLLSLLHSIRQILKTQASDERRKMVYLAITQVMVILSLTFSMIIRGSYDVAPVLSAISVFIIICGTISGDLFTVTDIGRGWLMDHSENLFIIADNKYRYLDSNQYARNIFPQLKNIQAHGCFPEDVEQIFTSEDGEFEYNGRTYVKKIGTIDIRRKTAAYSAILVDMTEQYRLLEEVKRQKEKAEEANVAKTNFLSNVSHEIRTPMNAIVGMTEIMLRHEQSEFNKEYLNNIKHSGDALLTVINDILDFNKIESGKLEIIPDEYEPLTMLNELKMIFLNRIGDKPIELIYDIDDNLPYKLYGDAGRIRQVLINIVNNGIKYTDEGYVKLITRLEMLPSGKAMLCFDVEDSGMGIKEEDIGKLFSTFSQVDTKKNRGKEGSGLGLSIAKQLCEAMGGAISVKSVYGKGSTFSFSMEQEIVDSKPAIEMSDSAPAQESIEQLMSFTAPDARILVVDDNELNLKVAAGLMEPVNMQIDTADNGKRALEMVQHKEYDIVFMDHMMPIMDGVEAASAIRALEGEYYRSLPIIALTANALAEAKEEFAAAGMNDFLSKPINTKELMKMLLRYLPADKIIESDARGEQVNASESDLPDIEGLNVAAGIENSGGAKLFTSLLGDFYKLIDRKATKIEKCLADGMIRDYTIEVHALKNTARMIGALELSDMFYELEQAGNSGDMETIENKTAEVLSLYRSYKPVLEPYAVSGNEDKSEISHDELIETLRTLKSAMDEFDLDGADAAMKKLETSQMPESIITRIDDLGALVADVAMEDVMNLCDEIINELS